MRKFDKDEAIRLKAEEWQLALLAKNPEYVHWGPGEDSMSDESKSWSGSVTFPTWEAFGPWGLDELNECVNFYFSVERENFPCPYCKGKGYSPAALELDSTFYDQRDATGRVIEEGWHDKITEEEVQLLAKHNRLFHFTRNNPEKKIPSAEEVNQAQRSRNFLATHDAINRHLLIKHRTLKQGAPVKCPSCEGYGFIYSAPDAHVSVTLWMLHPRKGCSRGVLVNKITQEDLPKVFEFLRNAAERNATRFKGIG